MAITFPAPSDVLTNYKTILKSLRPDVNTDDPTQEAILRGKVLSGLMSGIYGDQQNVLNDTFTADARPTAVLNKGAAYGMSPQPATAAVGVALPVTGTAGKVVLVGTTLQFLATGCQYTVTSGCTLDGAGHGTINVQCSQTGQIGNISSGNTITFVSPPTGVNANVVLNSNISDGSDQESIDAFRARVIARDQNPPAGGNQADYPNFAFKASPAVRSANIYRWALGLGTVAVYITTGTTDIDTAVTQGLSVVQIPSSQTLATVQAYYNANVPLTDAPTVYAPASQNYNVTVEVVLADGITLSTIPTDSVNNPLNLTVQQLVQREVQRVIYKTPIGGRKIPSLTGGWLVASDIERQLDAMLSAVVDPSTGQASGLIPVLADRQVQQLNPGVAMNIAVANGILPQPGTVTVNVGVGST